MDGPSDGRERSLDRLIRIADGLDTASTRGIPAGLYSIDHETAVATLLRASSDIPLFNGFDCSPRDGLMYAIVGSSYAQSIVSFDLDAFAVATVAEVPPSVYGGMARFRLDSVAVGDGKVYLTSASAECVATEQSLTTLWRILFATANMRLR